MTVELTEPYRVLGLKPGASVSDVKAAHRDLAKVWHPDRFLHDQRLQQKAQEKLKEINEAYDQLTGKTKPRTPAGSQQRNATVNVGVARRIRGPFVVAPVLIFAATFSFAFRSLLRTGEQVDESSIPAIQEVQHPANRNEQQSPKGNSSAKASPGSERIEKSARNDFSGAARSEPNAALLQPLPTVTVIIDSSTGMLARPWCPMKTSMTYPSGNEPRAYCASHRAAPIPPLESGKQ